MQFTEDLDTFFTDFADTATIGSAQVAGVFENSYAAAFDDLVEGSSPAFTAPSAAVSAVAVGAAITINSVAWRVVRIEPDGAGITVLVLK